MGANMKSCFLYCLVFALFCLSPLAKADADFLLIQNNGACFESTMLLGSDSSCETADNQRSARSKIRGFFYGQIIKRIWKNPKEQTLQNRLDNDVANQTTATQQNEKIQHQSVFQKLLDDAEFDVDASSHRLIFAIKMRF